jgi:hypothetical protein
MWINQQLDILQLERMARKIGRFITPDPVYSSINDKIDLSTKLRGFQKGAWKTKLYIDHKAYTSFLAKFSGNPDWNSVLELIDQDTAELVEFLRIINAGTSVTDANLIANAQWIRSKSLYEPLILTDDEDLLTSAHVVSSFFGISLGCLSSYEALRLAKIDEPYRKCCQYYGIKESVRGIDQTWSRDDLEREISLLLKKGKLACHVNNYITGLFRRRP